MNKTLRTFIGFYGNTGIFIITMGFEILIKNIEKGIIQKIHILENDSHSLFHKVNQILTLRIYIRLFFYIFFKLTSSHNL